MSQISALLLAFGLFFTSYANAVPRCYVDVYQRLSPPVRVEYNKCLDRVGQDGFFTPGSQDPCNDAYGKALDEIDRKASSECNVAVGKYVNEDLDCTDEMRAHGARCLGYVLDPEKPVVSPPNADQQQPQENVAVQNPPEGESDIDPANTTGPSAYEEAQTDLAQCSGSQSSANSCCLNPAGSACSADMSADERYRFQAALIKAQPPQATSGGMLETCRQLSESATHGSDANSIASNVCMARKSGCSGLCNSFAQKYQAKLSSCGAKCGDRTLYQETLAKLQNSGRSCSSLTATGFSYDNQSSNMITAGSQKKHCEEFLKMQSNLEPASVPNAKGLAVPESKPLEELHNAERTGFAGAQDSTRNSLPKISTDLSSGAGSSSRTLGPQVSVRRVPGNSGGFDIGSDGQATMPGKTVAAAFKSKADILRGLHSAEGYSNGSGGGSGLEADTQAQRKPASAAETIDPNEARLKGLDLKQYLPQSNVAGLSDRDQINGSGLDIWEIISNKYVETCKFGRLYECEH